MEQTIAALQNPRLSPREYAEIDVAFHACLAAASGNSLFGILSQSLDAVMIDPIRFTFERSASARIDTLEEHGRILERVKARDPEGARRAMAESLVDAPRNWVGFPARESTLIPSLAKASNDTVDRANGRSRKRLSPRRQKSARDGSG
jgi:DNA-binding FadR family transcriptional regulator